MMQQSVLSPEANVDAPPRAEIYAVQDGERNSNAMYMGGDRSLGKPQGPVNVYEQRLKNINKSIEKNRALNQEEEVRARQTRPELQTRTQELQTRHQQNQQQSYDDEDEMYEDNSDQYRNDGGDHDESADMDMPVTERNQQSQRNQDRDYGREQDAQGRGRKHGQIEKSG